MKDSRTLIARIVCIGVMVSICTTSGLAAPDCTSRGTAVEFDGVDDCFVIPYSASFPTAVFTASAWINLPRLAQNGVIVGRGEDNVSDNASWALLVYGDKFAVQLEDSSERDFVYEAPVTLTARVWHHVAATRSFDGTLVSYLDGVQIDQRSLTFEPSSNNHQVMSIGCYLASDGFPAPPCPPCQPPHSWLVGTVDDVTVWNRVLSPAEIAALFQGPPAPNASGLVGLWRFEEATGQLGLDSSTEGNNGTLGFTTAAETSDPAWVTFPLGTPTVYLTGSELSVSSPPYVASAYDIVRGDLGTLRGAAGDFSSSTRECLANNLAGTSLSDSDSPDIGQAFWFLARHVNGTGNGTYNSCSSFQIGDRDPGIATSGVDCP